MAKKTAIACAACIGIVWGLVQCLRSVPGNSPSQAAYHHAPDWKLEIVAQAPRLIYPTAIAVAPDGRVFVGQNPIDMTGPADQPIDSIACVHPNGRITIFATNLHCVFGLQYLDGKLYVNHAPKCSVFTDRDSVGADRIDLFDYPNPRQLLAGAITHIPAGIHWAMDGFIYMAVGDAGIYQAVGKDGRTLSMHSGGIIRFRPDGTELEIYSTGTRNHPDLAINPEGEIFTYDNTDDGHGWWTRVTHMVDGGFYGYPWDYLPRRPYTLWMMGDYSGGAGTAAFAYNEDALPAQFQGNLFLGDYARSELLRLRVEREAGTYKIRSREWHNGLDFLTRGSSEFRPIGVAVSPDGLSLYITDWNTYLSWDEVVTGRLLKLTYLGKSQAKLRPGWVSQAGTGKDFTASTDELVAVLRHPAESVRLIAQRRLAARGAEAGPSLIKLLEDRSAPAPARWSALWALDAWDGGVSGRKAIMAALKDPDASMRRQAARQLGTRKVSEAVTNLLTILHDSDASVRFQAATALGRTRAAAAVPALRKALAEKDLFARYAAFTALNRIGQARPEAWKEIIEGLSSPDAQIREGVVFALRETYSSALVPLLCAYVSNAAKPLDTRVGVLEVLGEMARQPAGWKGDWWGATAANPASRPRPAKTQDWEGTAAATAVLRESLNDPQLPVRRAAIVGLRRCDDVAAGDLLHPMLSREPDLELAGEILNTLGELKDPQFSEVLVLMSKDATRYGPLLPSAAAAAEKVGGPKVITTLTALVESTGSDSLRILSIRSLANLKAESAVPAIAKCVDAKDTNVWFSAISALFQLGGDSAAEALARRLTDQRFEVRQAVTSVLGKLKQPAAVPGLILATQNEVSRPAALSLLTRIPDLRALDLYLEGLRSNDRSVQKRCLNAVDAIQMEALPLIEDQMEHQRPDLIPEQFIPILQHLGGGFKIQEWQFLGPLTVQSPEAQLNQGPPVFDAPLGNVRNTDRWNRVTGKPLSGRVNLSELLNGRILNGNSFMYLAASFNRSTQQEMELTATCDGPLALWLNGRRLLTYADGKRPSYRAVVTVKRGNNKLLARIENPQKVAQFAVGLGPPPLPSGLVSSVQVPKEVYATWARNNSGNAARGRKWFSDPSGAGCIRCHRVNGEGGALGPDLSGIGTKYNREQLIEAVLYPSRQILAGYQQTFITATDGENSAGLVQREDERTINLLDASGQEHTIQKSRIAQRKLSAVSLMPDGLHAAWRRDQFCDVIAFLEGLKAPQQANLR